MLVLFRQSCPIVLFILIYDDNNEIGPRSELPPDKIKTGCPKVKVPAGCSEWPVPALSVVFLSTILT